MKQIELSQGRVAIVDDEDFEWLSKWKWHYIRRGKTGYAERRISSKPPRVIHMHVAIIRRYKHWKHGCEVGHRNTCDCDNRKKNLRLTARGGQRANQGKRTDNTSGIPGVHWYERRGKWIAYINANKRRDYLGYFEKFEDAVTARHKAEIKYFGEYRHDPTNVCPLGHTGECPDCAARLRGLRDA